MGNRPRITDQAMESLGDIHHQAQEIQRLVVLCMSNDRIGHEWLLKMLHSKDRMVQQLERLSA